VLVAAGSAMVVLARALFGPFHLGIAVYSPLTAESIFAVCLLALILTGMHGRWGEVVSPHSFRWQPLLIGLGGIALAFWGAQRISFLSDDYFVVLDALRGRGANFLGALASDRGGLYCRPVAYTLLWLKAAWLGTGPLQWHLLSFALHLVNCCLVYALALRLGLGAWTAALASALFGVHGSRPESAVWVTGYFELVSALFFLASLVLYLYSQGHRSKFRYVVALMCFLAAVWCKESAYVLPAVLLIVPWTAGENWRERTRAVAPFLVIAAIAFLHRWWSLGGIGGYLDPVTGQSSAGNVSLVRLAKLTTARLWAVLIFPIDWEVRPGAVLVACLAAMLAALLYAALSNVPRAAAAFGLCAALLGALPASSQLLIGSDLQKSRLLYLPSIGFAILLASLVNAVESSKMRVLIGAALVAFHAAALQHNLSIWERVSAIAQATCSGARRLTRDGPHEVATVGVPGSIQGVYFFENGLKECLEMEHSGVWTVLKFPTVGLAQSGPGRSVLLWNEETRTLAKVAE